MSQMEAMRNLIGRKDNRPVAELWTRAKIGFEQAGYSVSIRNEAFMRPGGITAKEYLDTPEGKRFRGALLVRLQRGNYRAEVYITEVAPYSFELRRGDAKPERLDRVDRAIMLRLKDLVDKGVEMGVGATLALFRV